MKLENSEEKSDVQKNDSDKPAAATASDEKGKNGYD